MKIYFHTSKPQPLTFNKALHLYICPHAKLYTLTNILQKQHTCMPMYNWHCLPR